jgi:hypothetical protein
MKMMIPMMMLICLPLLAQTTEPTPIPPSTVAIYPASIEAMVKMWNSLAEVCAKAGVESYDVYASNITDDGMVLKITSDKYVKFVSAALAAYGAPLLRVSQFEDEQIASASFTYTLSWAANGAKTALDDEIRRIGQTPQPKTMQIIVVCVGKPDMNSIFGLFNKEIK